MVILPQAELKPVALLQYTAVWDDVVDDLSTTAQRCPWRLLWRTAKCFTSPADYDCIFSLLPSPLHPCAREDRTSFRKRARISGVKASFRKKKHRESENCAALIMKRERRTRNISEGSKEQFRDRLSNCQQGQLSPHKSVVYLRVTAFLTHSPSGFPHSSYRNKKSPFQGCPISRAQQEQDAD